MENQERLPRGYEKRFVIDPRKNRKQALAVWGVSLLIALVLFGVAQAIWQGQALLLFTHRVTFYVTWVILIFGFLIYAVLHEVIRGLCVRLVTGRRPQHYDNTLPGVYMNSKPGLSLQKGLCRHCSGPGGHSGGGPGPAQPFRRLCMVLAHLLHSVVQPVQSSHRLLGVVEAALPAR